MVAKQSSKTNPSKKKKKKQQNKVCKNKAFNSQHNSKQTTNLKGGKNPRQEFQK